MRITWFHRDRLSQTSPCDIWALLGLAWLLPALASGVSAADLTLDLARTNGVIRPLHGVNLGPLCYRGMVDLSAFHKELGVPWTRLHDVTWLNAEAVDVHTVFPDLRNDPAKAENYRFAPTDDYLQAIVNVGSGIIYRLGESIEHTPRKYHVNPPPDPERWAEICAGIVRHYNEGWANGFKHGIRYWEIWNEPDVRPQMWTGSEEQFLRLFAITARRIKSEFPGVRVGGPAVGGTGEFTPAGFKPAAFAVKFLDYCKANQVPLDFFSWHRYTSDPRDLPRRAKAMRQLLDDHGFAKTESHFNEWNYLPRDDWEPMGQSGAGPRRQAWFAEMSGPRGAAFAATALMLLQDTPLDVCNFYTGEIQGFGLFNLHGMPQKNYYAFKAFRQLLNTPLRVATPESGPGRLTFCAGLGSDAKSAALLASNFDSAETRVNLSLTGLPWEGPTHFEVLRVDAARDLARAEAGELAPGQILELSGLSAPVVVLVKLRAAQ
jgi:xylan 1,4-beta-xylosidase